MLGRHRGHLWRLLAVVAIGIGAGVSSATAAEGAVTVVEAVKKGDGEALRRLLQQGADVNAPEPDGTTALHWAAHRAETDTVDRLIRSGANVTATNRYGVTPLALACQNGTASIVERLLQAGASPNAALPGGETALMTAARTGDVATVKILIAYGADVDARENSRGQTGLMWAAAAGNPAAIRALVAAGADIHAQAHGPAPPIATNSGATTAAASNKASSNKKTAANATGMRDRQDRVDSFTPLLFAVREGHSNAVRALLESGADVNETSAEGIGPLLVATANAHWELAALLLDAGADPNAARYGWSALHQLIRTRSLGAGVFPLPVPTGHVTSFDVAKRMIATGADVNLRITQPFDDPYQNKYAVGATPFLLAARGVDHEMMRLLVANGADPNVRTPLETTALMWAAGVDISRAGPINGTMEDALEAVTIALDLGNDVNDANLDGETALIGAAHRGSPRILQLLIDTGAKLDAKTKRPHRLGVDKPGQVRQGPEGNGCTALMMAVSTPNCRPSTVREPQPEAEALLRRALRERGLPDDVDTNPIRMFKLQPLQ